MIISLDLFSKFSVGESYYCKTRTGIDCTYTVISRTSNVITFEKTWIENNEVKKEYKKFKINKNGFMEQVLVWAYKDTKYYLRACNKIENSINKKGN